MMLAAIPGELIGLVIFAVAALLKWLGDRATAEEARKTSTRPTVTPDSRGTSSTSSWEVDEERKRKFMEALGLPTDDQPARREAPMTLRPQTKVEPPALPRRSAHPPIPPFVYQEPSEKRQKRKKQVQQVQPAPAVMVPEALPAPVPVAVVSAPAESSGFELQRDFSGGEAATPERVPRDTLAVLREELGRQDSVRRAFLLREILGPPPGLQMPGSIPSFRSP